MSEQQTIQKVLQSASVSLADCSDSGLLDAKVLLAHILGKDLTYLITWSDKILDEQEVEAFYAILKRRIAGEPVAYLTGYKEFWSQTLAVAPSTLIPRPDTETLVELVLEHNTEKSQKVLDLGTGTGAIAIALAVENPDWKITAVDMNEEAVRLAEHNIAQCGCTNVTALKSDWFNALSAQKYDVIVSNPPYIDPDDKHLNEGDVRFEPLTALIADNKGLADIEHIVENARSHFSKQGQLYIEHGYDQGQAVRDIFDKYGYQSISTEQDLSGNDRITWALFYLQQE